jgi:hypothetical protein
MTRWLLVTPTQYDEPQPETYFGHSRLTQVESTWQADAIRRAYATGFRAFMEFPL